MNEYPPWFVESLLWIDKHLFLVALALTAITYIAVIAGSTLNKKISLANFGATTFSWKFWLFFNFLGGTLGGLYSDYLGEGNNVWAIYGATLGLAQWFVLRNTLPVTLWWVIATTIGWGTVPFIGENPYGGAITGFLIGALQMISLKAKNKMWWILGNSIVVLFTGLLGHIIIMDILYDLAGPHVSWSLGWGTLSLIAAVCLLPILPRLYPDVETFYDKKTTYN